VMLQIYPKKYEPLDLSADEKSFLRTIERAMIEEELAYFVLHINPRKKENQGKAELFILLLLNKGILLFRFLEIPNEAALYTIRAFSNGNVYETLKNDIVKRLEESRYLTEENGRLRFALNICFVFPKVDESYVESRINENERKFCSNYVLFKDAIINIRKDGAEVVKRYLNSAEEFKEEFVNNVFQRLCPEITIPRKYILDEHSVVLGKDTPLDITDRSVQSYRLDSKQIDIVNKIAKGNQLILACAGSGKSVLLISKCFKLASLNPSENFLLTCYNSNLNNYYQWAISIAGFTDKNVQCSTFFKLCIQLLENNNLPVPRSSIRDDTYYDKLFEVTNNALSRGEIKDRFYGIFIDEVQIFKPEWYRFCFNLLKSKNAEDHFFVIAGDKSQDIKNNIKHGKAPWQGGGDSYPEYRGKTLAIEFNYRNSKPINDAIDSFVACAKKLGAELDIDLTSDPELFLRGTAYRGGNPPTLVELSDFSNNGECQAIGDSIKDLIENKNISEVDIAVILYNTRIKRYYSPHWKDIYYSLIPGIDRYFSAQGWEPPAVLMYGKSEGVTYGSRRGVTITTIEGSLGLDFRAVVLAGLHPLGIHEKARTLKDFVSLTQDKIEAFKKNINFLYTGCTRARDELTIILSAPKDDSIYLDLLRTAMQEVQNR